MRQRRALVVGFAFVLLVSMLFGFAGAVYAQDADGDGLPDTADRCPREAGPRENGGCPVAGPPPADRDGDGVLDFVDGCPDQAGTGFTNGCPVEAIPIGTLAPTPVLIMVWDSTDVCMFGVPMNASANVNVREEPTTSSAILGQMQPGDQFEALLRDYDENNDVWVYGEALVGIYGWVFGDLLINNGQCVNLPQVIHIDAPESGPRIEVVFDPDTIPQVMPDDVIVDGRIITGWEGLFDDDPADDVTPTPTGRRPRPQFYDFSGLDIRFLTGDGSVIPVDQFSLNFARIKQGDDDVCLPIGADFCLDAVLLLPAVGDPFAGESCPLPGEGGFDLTSPEGERALIGLLLPAVQKVREAAARMGDGSVVPAEALQDFHFSALLSERLVDPPDPDYPPNPCSAVLLLPAMGDGSVMPVDIFILLLPAVQ